MRSLKRSGQQQEPGNMPRRRRAPLRAAAGCSALTLAVLAGAAACGGSSGAQQTGASAKQTITVSMQGLGAEGNETLQQFKAFEQANPNIKINPLVLSPQATTAYQQLTTRFTGGDSPDVVIGDVTWAATFGKAGWVAQLDSNNPNLSSFFPAIDNTVSYGGHTYGVPWFINAEGLFYRTDLIKTPPQTPAQLVSDAQAAMKQDPSLKEGLAFEGDKYEGVVTALQNFLAGFGGKLDPSNMNNSANQQALQFMHDTIYKYKIAPQAVTGWQESNVQEAFTSGQAAFAINWPFVLQVATTSPVKGKVGFVPFPSQTGSPAAALGGDDLMISAQSSHKAAAWKLIQFLTSQQQQVARAIPTGDAPASPAAYTQQLYSGASFFKQAYPLFKITAARPVSPNYLQMSDDLQTMLSGVLANQQTPSAGLSSVAGKLKSLGS